MSRLPIHQLDPDPDSPFPPVELARREPDGLLAAGGDLHPCRLLNAYRHGIFPWFSDGSPILWWSPDPRVVFDPATFALPGRFRRSLRKSAWMLRADTAFDEVIAACSATVRPGEAGTWITAEMMAAYRQLHRLGHAHSVEVFDGPRLVGGIYGVAVGQMFFGESMFSLESGGSKVALAGLLRLLRKWHWPLLDAQVENPHLMSLGARRMPRKAFVTQVQVLSALPGEIGSWAEFLRETPASGLAKPLD